MPGPSVLIVKTHAFGDALLCTPAVAELAREGETALTVLTGPSAAPVWERFPGLDRVMVAPLPPSGPSQWLRLLPWTIRHARDLSGFDRSLVFQGSPAVRRWIRLLTGKPVRSCGGRPLGRWEEVFPMNEGDLAGSAYARVAGVAPEDFRPVFPVRESETRWAAELGLPAPLFAVAPGGGRNPRDTVLQKRWMPERYAAVAERLAETGMKVVLLGGEDDSAAADHMASCCTASMPDLTGRTTWGQTAAVLDRCCGFLGADSGTAHLAVSRNVPSVVLFGPSSPEALYAGGLAVPVRGRADCSPCYSNSLFPGCVNESAVCMESIDVETVWHTVRRMLNENIRG